MSERVRTFTNTPEIYRVAVPVAVQLPPKHQRTEGNATIMTTHHDNAATTWRDLADQLTPEQVEKLAAIERHSDMPADEMTATLLNGAREWATCNVVDHVAFGDVEPPPDATHCYLEEMHPGAWARCFDGTERKVCWSGACGVVSDVQVFISGQQYQDGHTVRSIGIDARDDYDAATARRIAAAIIAAADEIEARR
jgi:hypothetical protein